LLGETTNERIAREMKDKEAKLAEESKKMNAETFKRQSFLISKITQIFREREITFYDCFETIYDPLKAQNNIPIK